MSDALLGFRVHTGWATAVALTASGPAPQVVDRRRLALVEKTDHDSVFVYHAAAELDVVAADAYVATARNIAGSSAEREIGQLLSDLAAAGYTVCSAGLPLSAGRALPSLGDILRSHTLLHAAEGELFRRALAAACATHGLRVTGVPPKELYQQAARVSGLRLDRMRRRITELGGGIGPPWGVDQKEAALAALIAGADRKPS